MNGPAGNKDGESTIVDLFGRLADDGRAYVKAEAGLYRAIAMRRAAKARNGVIALIFGALLLEAALIVLLVGAALALAMMIGPLLGGLVVSGVAGLVGFLLIRFGAERVKALAGDAEEKAELASVEKIS